MFCCRAGAEARLRQRRTALLAGVERGLQGSASLLGGVVHRAWARLVLWLWLGRHGVSSGLVRARPAC